MKNQKMSDLNHLVKLSNSLQDLTNLSWQLNRRELLYCINSRNWFHHKKEEIIIIMYPRISSVKFVRITKKMRKDIISIWFYVILRTLWLPTLVSGPKKMILSFNMYYLRNFTTDVFIISFKLNETLYVLKWWAIIFEKMDLNSVFTDFK